MKETIEDFRGLLHDVANGHAKAVVTLMPYQISNEKQAEITDFNRRLKQLYKEENVIVIDLNPVLAPHGRLLPENTTDRVHFSQAAYSVWKKKLREVVMPKT